MSITRTPIFNDDGSGTTGTIFENAWKQELYDQIDAALLIGGSYGKVYLSSTGQVNNFVLPDRDVVTIVVLSASAVTLTGFSAIRDGQRVVIHSATTAVVSLPHGHAASTAKFSNIVTSGPTPIGAGGGAIYVAIDGYYRLVSHEQGPWINVPYSAANYNNATVEAADVVFHQYKLMGKTLEINVYLSPITVNAGVSFLSIGGFSTYTPQFTYSGVYPCLVFNNGAWVLAAIRTTGGSAIEVSLVAGGNYATTANSTHVHATCRFPVN
jgi:hypothetical protein